MKGFVYWLPGVAANLKAVEAFGVPALKGSTIVPRGCAGPPGDGRGGTLAWRDAPGVHWGMDANAQVWRKVAKDVGGASGEYWIGFEKDAKPQPKGLLRARTYAGDDVQTSAGVWKVPKGRLFPSTYGLTESGEIGYSMQGELGELSLEGTRWIRALVEKSCDDLWAFGLAARVLGLNYFVGIPELAALGALNMSDVKLVLDSFIDLPFLEGEWKKKQEAESPSSNAGTSSAGPEA